MIPAMTTHRLTVAGAQVPSFVYGTAWKELETERLTRLAIEAGFRASIPPISGAITTRRGWARPSAAIADGLTRDELFIQTKFTFVGGQDHRLPYDPARTRDAGHPSMRPVSST